MLIQNPSTLTNLFLRLYFHHQSRCLCRQAGPNAPILKYFNSVLSTAIPPQLPFADGFKRKEIVVKNFFNEETWEFTAKIVSDLGKNIVSIGFASYFFKDLPLPFRVGFVILGVGLIFWSIYLISQKGGK